MSRKLPWGVAVGVTLLISVTGCSQQPGRPSASPTDVCGLVAAPVTTVLTQNGITATPVDDGSSSACRWQDTGSGTTVTLRATDAGATGVDAPNTTVPGVDDARVVGPGELAFTVGGRSWDLTVESPRADDVDSRTATEVASAVGAALGATPDQPDARPADQSGGQPAGDGGACDSEQTFCVTVDITGATTLHGTAQTINLGTCADYAAGTSGGSFQLPGLLGAEVGGHKVNAVNEIRTYSGPGTYDTDLLRSVAGVLDVDIDTTPYQLADNTTAQAVINPDGSGRLTFTDLKEGEQGNPTTPKGTISGSFTWTCSD